MNSKFIGTNNNNNNNKSNFKFIRIDTSCNLRSILSLDKYVAYYRNSRLGNAIKQSTGKWINGIGGVKIPIGVAAI